MSKASRRCLKAGGHWAYPINMIGWKCLMCGYTREGIWPWMDGPLAVKLQSHIENMYQQPWTIALDKINE